MEQKIMPKHKYYTKRHDQEWLHATVSTHLVGSVNSQTLIRCQ